MISERTLRQWRKEALVTKDTPDWDEGNANWMREMSRRILLLTQELMDLHLMRKE
jgi:hypothetical protein